MLMTLCFIPHVLIGYENVIVSMWEKWKCGPLWFATARLEPLHVSAVSIEAQTT